MSTPNPSLRDEAHASTGSETDTVIRYPFSGRPQEQNDLQRESSLVTKRGAVQDL